MSGKVIKEKLRDEAIGDNSKVPYKPFGRTSRQSNGNTEKDSCTKILQKKCLKVTAQYRWMYNWDKNVCMFGNAFSNCTFSKHSFFKLQFFPRWSFLKQPHFQKAEK